MDFWIKASKENQLKYIIIEDTDLMTINNNSYRVYRYEGCLSDIDNATVLLLWKADDEFIPSNMKCFLSTDIDLSNFDILSYYQNRWSIELYLKNIKQYLGFGEYQMRKSKAINRYLLLQLTYCYLTSQITYCFGTAISDSYSKKHYNTIEFIHTQTLFGTSLMILNSCYLLTKISLFILIEI